MHFIFGGAFNGKRKWVKERYHDAFWCSAYRGDKLVMNSRHNVMVIEGIEQYIKESIEEGMTIEEVRRAFQTIVTDWLLLEASGHQVVIIGTEIGKGIVPMNPQDRAWRDSCGYVYQHIVKNAHIVDHIWYGVSNRLKGEQE
ncbi:bifunctional adenosylcobinamide kinase/adenosylcobinamide-phosphate guanylyltransferase [Metabacillus iocasae]|uniref:Adenosyl cobinamide kinase/adenosyl cobinamide phosphate guanylyltransferase n=1 Tax=Priestia iocasae TaxID=2291674 RepID=A0ABS2QRC4_9BACI|nr:bifunctional adenosylcobinamide kinase/adenosylcobinamide-phosphate guanylyltransferase [Metabacillus iocasae]MBM7701994.1 adenosyl cobinamide kinase/adenosyl cobinamide phosphate guanylyltransferase [Metabacillus iocasae]